MQHVFKIRLDRVEFLNAWQTAERSSNAKSTVSAVSGVLIKVEARSGDDSAKATLEATDFKTAISLETGGVELLSGTGGMSVLPVRLIGEFLKKISNDTVDIEINGDRGVLIAGRNRVNFTTAPVDDFPKIPRSDDAEALCSVLAQDLSKVLARGCVASAMPAEFPKYLGTCLLRPKDGMLTVVSTDSKRLSLAKCPCELSGSDDGIKVDLLLPMPALKELIRLLQSRGEASVQVLYDTAGSTAWFKFTEPDLEFSIRRVETSFPNYERILTSNASTTLKIQRSELVQALERVDIIARETIAHLVALNLRAGGERLSEFKMTTRSPDSGMTALEVLDADVIGEDLRVGFNAGYMLDGLRALDDGIVTITMNGEEGQSRLTLDGDDSFLYMLMPARLSPQDNVEMDADESNDDSVSESEQRVS